MSLSQTTLLRSSRVVVLLIGALALIGLLAGRSSLVTVPLGALFLALFALQLLAQLRGLSLRQQYGMGPAAISSLLLELTALLLGLNVLLGGYGV